MPGPEFFQTLMGRTFYEATAPRIATALERIADALDKGKACPHLDACPADAKAQRKKKTTSSAGEARRKLLADPEDIFDAVKDMFPAEQEAFVVVAIDIRNGMIGDPTVVALGHVHGVDVHPREVFREAIRKAAAAIIVAHNHPSGDPTPSPEDLALTRRLRQAGDLVGIPVIDHVVVGGGRYRSIAESMGAEWKDKG